MEGERAQNLPVSLPNLSWSPKEELLSISVLLRHPSGKSLPLSEPTPYQNGDKIPTLHKRLSIKQILSKCQIDLSPLPKRVQGQSRVTQQLAGPGLDSWTGLTS